MPIHDWTKVPVGIFHDLHLAWIVELQRTLNGGVLSDAYYAQAERPTTGTGDDSLLPEPLNAEAEAQLLAGRANRLVIFDARTDRRVALLQIVAPGHKSSQQSFEQLTADLIAACGAGHHLLLIDLFPPGACDAAGVHGKILRHFGGSYEPPPEKPLTLASYVSGGLVKCYVEPTAVGSELPPMPLFLDTDHHVTVPLESTYMAAYGGVPQRWTWVLESGS
jgi:hypothetical protein